jgi:hypothetical protein
MICIFVYVLVFVDKKKFFIKKNGQKNKGKERKKKRKINRGTKSLYRKLTMRSNKCVLAGSLFGCWPHL